MKRKIINTDERGTVIFPTGGMVWMTQHEIADLFGCFVFKVNSNIRSIPKSGVLHEADVCRMFRYNNDSLVEMYGLEMIVALSFRIQSRYAELFRKYLIRS